MANRPDLVSIEVAAAELGVPKQGLRAAAARAGMLIYIGRAIRIDRNTYGELIEACRAKPQEQGSTNARIPGSSSSATPVARKRRLRLIDFPVAYVCFAVWAWADEHVGESPTRSF